MKKTSKPLGFLSSFSLLVGTIVGVGVFYKVATVAEGTGASSLSLFTWLLSGLISLCGALTIAELAVAFPMNGGVIHYLGHTYGRLVGFLMGWAQTIIYYPVMIATLATLFGQSLCSLLGISSFYSLFFGLGALFLLTFLNVLSTRWGGRLQVLALMLKLIPLAIIVVLSFAKGSQPVNLFPIDNGNNFSFFSSVGAGMLATMYAYDGWIYLGNIAGEIREPAKTIPKVIGWGMVTVMGIYLLVNFAFMRGLGFENILGNTNAPQDLAKQLLQGNGGRFISIGVMFSVFGGLNGTIMMGMRQPQRLAQEGLLPFSGTLSRLWGAGSLQALFATVLVFVGIFSFHTFESLSNTLVFVIWTFYIMVFIAVPLLRTREPELLRPYKVPFSPFVPAIAILGGLYLLMMVLADQPALALIGIFITALGLPVYYFRRKTKEP